MSRMILPVLVIALAVTGRLEAQVQPAQPTPPPPQTSPRPPRPPVPPPPPDRGGRLIQAPGLLFAPPASQSYLGVHLMEVSEDRAGQLGLKEPYGVEIMSVASDSPAEEGGIRKGDVIIRYGGQRVEGQEQLVRLVRETPVGRKVELTVFRGGSEVNLEVEIGERKSAPNVLFRCGDEPCEIHIPNIQIRSFDFDIPRPRMVTQSRLLGAELESIEGQLAEHFGVKGGVLVRSVDANSPASRAGLKAGDVIVEVAGKTVRDPGQIREAARNGGSEKAVPLGVIRNRSRISLELEPQTRDTGSSMAPGRSVASRAERF
jgi:serine protease Do